MKQNYFYYWKIMKEDKYLLINKNKKLDSLKAIQFCSILMKIFNKKFESSYYSKYFLNNWKFLMNEKDLYNNKIKKAIIILSSLFNRKIRKIFKKFPRNYLNIKQKSNIFQEINNNKHITDLIENNEKYYQKGLQDFYNYKKKYINLLIYLSFINFKLMNLSLSNLATIKLLPLSINLLNSKDII